MKRALILDSNDRIPTMVVTMTSPPVCVPAFRALIDSVDKYEYRKVESRHLKESELWMFAALHSDVQSPKDEEKRNTFNYLWEKGKEVINC